MASISSPGIGSGLDVQGLVSKLVAAEGDPVTQRLDTKETTLQAKLSAFGALKSSLASFQGSLSSLTSLSSFGTRSATSSNTDLFSATVTNAAVAGNYQIEVQQLAKAQSLQSGAFTDTTSAIGTGTLTFQFGDSTKAAQTITIDSSNNSLQGIRDAVNAANIGVRASIVYGNSGYQLVFSSTETGTANSLKISVVENPADGTNTDMTGLSQFAYDPTAAVGSGKNMTESVAAKDAIVAIDGITVTRSTNTISDAVAGVTLNLKSEAPGSPATLSIALDKTSVTNAINGFVTSYNNLIGNINKLTAYNADTKQAGLLIGDSTVRTISSRLSSLLTNTVDGLDGAYRALVDIGITTQSDGTLAVDSTKLDTALTNNFDDIGRIFAAAAKPTDSLVQYSSSTDATKVGDYALTVTQLATQGTYSDAASSVGSLVVDSTNDIFDIKVDGVQSGTITLTQKTYASAADLAAELQSRINGDSTLQAAGVSVTVGYDAGTNRFTFTSGRYGSASSVEITSVEDATASGNIGLTANSAASTTGVDVAGTIGGLTATGNGQYLTGTGDASGLKVLVLGGSTGSRGTVSFTRGVADQLNTMLDSLLATDGLLSNRTDTLNSQISDIGDQRTKLAAHLADVQARYLKQFTALDTLLAQMQQTSTYLTNQLASLPGASSK